MGDRGNIKLTGPKSGFPAPVYLYTHWSGSELPNTLARALHRGRDRWKDGQYLGRIIFCEMLARSSDSLMDTTGYGLSTEPGDNSYPFLTVDMDKQEVYYEPDSREGFNIAVRKVEDLTPVSFEQWIELHTKEGGEA